MDHTNDIAYLKDRIQELEDQLTILREAEPILSLPGAIIAIKALLKSLVSAKVPEERDAILEVAGTMAESIAAEAMPIYSLTDIDSPARRRMFSDIAAFLGDIRSSHDESPRIV